MFHSKQLVIPTNFIAKKNSFYSTRVKSTHEARKMDKMKEKQTVKIIFKQIKKFIQLQEVEASGCD